MLWLTFYTALMRSLPFSTSQISPPFRLLSRTPCSSSTTATLLYSLSSPPFPASLGRCGVEWCDDSTGTLRPYIPRCLRREVFNKLHNLAHPGVRASTKLVSDRFVWRDMCRNCQAWSRALVACQIHQNSNSYHPPLWARFWSLPADSNMYNGGQNDGPARII